MIHHPLSRPVGRDGAASPRVLARLFAATLFALALACGGEPARPAPSSADLADVEPQLRELFTAIDRAECAAIRARMPTLTTDERCREFLHDVETHGLELLEVMEVTRDGRDARSAVVRTGIRKGSGTRQVLIRATAEGGRWTFAM